MSEHNIIARIVRLETATGLKFKEIEKATTLARDQIEKDKTLQRTQLDHRLEGMNEFQRRMDKLEGTFATSKDLEGIKKMMWIGVGIAISFQFILGIFVSLLIYWKR